MRRLITAALLALFVCQSSGAAIAAPVTITNAPPLLAQIQFAFAQSLGSLQATHIGAFLTGKTSLYEAMHAAPPDFTEARKTHEHPNPDVERPVVAPIYHPGLPGHVVYPGPPDLKNIRPDPLAMKTSTGQATAVRKRVLFGAPPMEKPAFTTQQRHVVTPMTVGAANGSGTTGVNRWWTYEEGAIPGAGKWMVNVSTGNLIVQSDDVDVPERGIDLAFRRTYNSQSQHDYANTDGTVPSNFGNGWTNTFDAHLSYNSSTNVMTIYDIDGARYDYTSDGQGHWVSPAGMQGTNLFLSGACGYDWQKKNGTIYAFWLPYTSSNCGLSSDAGYRGRALGIYGRNYNNNIRFDYYWDNGDASTAAHLSSINVVHSDGQTLVLRFADFSGFRELASVTRDDGQAIRYGYDTSGNLTDVCDIGNGTADASPNASTICGDATHMHHRYGWNAGHQMAWADTPRWTMYWGGMQPDGSGGGYVAFGYDSNNRLDCTQIIGHENLTPSDGTGAQVQPGYPTSSSAVMATTWFGYPSGSETQLTDSDGHATNWFYDGSGRTSETQEWTGAPSNLWLTTYASWDGSNNLTETVDARGNATDYGYDGNGNTIWTQAPWITTSMGYGRPVARYSYDQFNNLVAYCDPQYVWTTGASSCNAGSGVTHYTWNYSDSNEPYGYLSDTYTPLGYHRWISYNNSAQGGDYGLPTDVNSDCVGQTDGTSRCPHQGFSYNSYGDMTYYGPGVGNWTIAYDNLNRVTAATDPDGVTSRTCYYQNGQISAKQTALQYSMDGGVVCGSHSTTFTYDADGNEISETNHVNNTADTTSKWYDGADRLVEVRLPYDSTDAFVNPWITRYIYDLTQGGNVTLGGTSSVSYAAHGNLYKTQELLVPGTSQQLSYYQGAPKIQNSQFQDTKGTAFDALDRPIEKYQFVGDVPHGDTESYDGAGYYGEATRHCNYVGQCGSMTYYTTGAIDQVTYSDGTPAETSTYDPDGRLASQQSSAFGTQTYTYDADSRLTTEIEPSGGGVTSAATLTYHYYADGMRSALDVSSSALNQPSLFAYAYRTDGKLQEQQINYGADAKVGSSALHFTYTNAGKLTQRTESGPAANANAISFQYDASTGVMTNANYPAAALSGFSYDAEGQLQTFTQNIYGYADSGIGSFSHTVRGEVLQDPRASGRVIYANAVSISGVSSSQVSSWDARSGRATGVGSPYIDVNGNTTGITFSYDGDGRQVGSDQAGSDHYGNAYDITNSRSYDAENHLTSGVQVSPNTYQSRNYYTTQTAYNWGPNGHPIRIGSTPQVYDAQATTSQLQFDTLHWDGNQLLFTTNATGQVDDIKVGSIGDITPLDSGYSGLTFYDRVAGIIAFCHNATGARGIDHTSATHSLVTGASDTVNPCAEGTAGMSAPNSIVSWGDARLAGGIGQGKLLGMAGPDGIDDGVNIIQGVRNYDPLQGQWTTPDAYAGDAHDPMSQKSYMWNKGNGAAFSDPSGYDASLTYDGYGAQSGDAITNAPDFATFEQDSDQTRVDSSWAASNGATFSELTANDIKLLNTGASYGYGSGAAAAFAANAKYDSDANAAGEEWGVSIYALSGQFGYGGLTKGDVDSVSIDYYKGVPAKAELVGEWHNHPLRDQTVDHAGQLQDFARKNPGTAWTVWSSVDGNFVQQVLGSDGRISSPVVLCAGCTALPPPGNSQFIGDSW